MGAIGPPLAVAVACVAGLAWFDRVWIPAQQQYFNERNLRALRTISAQIKGRVDNFDLAIDHAIDSFPIKNGSHELLRHYVKLFSPELNIVTFDPNSPEWKQLTPADPPSVRIGRDEGRSYLYLGYRHEDEHRRGRSRVAPVTLVARGDIEQVADESMTRHDFDALLLLDGHGATIAERSSSGLELASIEKLHDRGQDPATEPSVFDRIRGTSNLGIVTIGAADYMLYAQPVQLSLLHEDKDATLTPEEWTLCGLVRLDRFRAASSTISTTYWLWFGAALALISFTILPLKLRVLSPRERLHRVDGVLVACAIFMLMALAAFTALDLCVFGAFVPAAVDDELRAVAASISTNVRRESEAVARQMAAFEDEYLWQTRLEYAHEPYRNLPEVRQNLEQGEGADINLDSGVRKTSTQCKPSWSCRAGVLRQLGDIEYPFFKMVVWTDDAGWQRIKWSTSSVVTPFLNVVDAKLTYFDQVSLARRLWSSDPGVPTSGVSVISSPNTSEKLTVYWKALGPSVRVNLDPPRSDLTSEALATLPMSLTGPVLPNNVRFAVIDRSGLVLFHSDSARSLAENFIQESENSPNLRSLVTGRGGAMSGRYLGRTRRFYVTPLDMTPFGDPKWSLIVFQDAAVSETANLETINLALSMFGVYALALGVMWGLLQALWPGGMTKWLWPDPMKNAQYRCGAAIGVSASVLCLGAGILLPAAARVAISVVLIAGAVAVIFMIARGGARWSGESATWLGGFFWIRASLLFLLAAVPAVLCFQVAYDFHTELVVKRGQSHLSSALTARARRIDRAQHEPICSDSDAGTQPCPEVGRIVARRTMETLWDVDVPVAAGQPSAAANDTAFGSAPLRWFLMLAFRPYNATAADLLIASGEPDRWRLTIDSHGKRSLATAGVATDWQFEPAARPRSANGVFWLIVVALMGVACALVRFLLAPLFALDIIPQAPLLAATGAADETSLLVIGPPGSLGTERLRHPRVRVFDVRSLSFTDDPMEMAPSTAMEVSSAADRGPTIEERTADWPEAIHAAASQSVIVALDHLDYRLDDRSFREQLLECLESAVYGRGATIWCRSVRDPIELLGELDPPATDRHRWTRLFEGFRYERLALQTDGQRAGALARSLAERRDRLASDVRGLIVSECDVAPELLAIGENLASRLPRDAPMNGEAILAEISGAAAHVYEALWDGCAIDEKVALRQLAEEGLVNPNNKRAISRMLSAGLVRRDPTFRLMNETFRRFVLGAAPHGVISAWEHEGIVVPWGTIATTGFTVAFGLAGLLLLTQEQLVDAWIRYVPAIAPSIPTAWKLLTNLQKGRLDATT